MLTVILIISLFNHGLFYLYKNMSLFKYFYDLFEPKGYDEGIATPWKSFLFTPIFGCPICFSSIYGSIVFVLIAPYFNVFHVELYPVIIIGSVFTSQLLLYIKERIE